MTDLERARDVLARSPAEALEVIAEALSRAAPADAATLCLLRARAFRLLGRHDDALVAFDDAGFFALHARDPLLAAKTRIGKIDSLGMLGRFDDALALGEETVAALESLGAEGDAARARCNVGSLYWRLDRYEDALTRYESAAQTFAREGDAVAIAIAATNRANALACLGRVEEALPLHEQARDAYRSLEMEIEAAEVETNLGYLHHVSGRHAAALAALARAERTFVAQDRPHEAARARIDAAEAEAALNLWPECLGHLDDALATFARLPLPDDEARARSIRALALAAQGRIAEARADLDAAETLFQSRKNLARVAHVRLTRGALPGGALSDLQAAARTFSRLKLAGWAAEARFALGERNGHTARSLGAIRRAAKKHHRGWLECRASRMLGRLYAAQGKRSEAIRAFRQAAFTLEAARTQIAPEALHVAFLEDKLGVYEDLVGALLARGRPLDVEEALAVVERAKSRLLLERVLASRPESVETPNALRAQLSRAYRESYALDAIDPDDPRRFTASTLPLGELERAWDAARRADELQRDGGRSLAGIESLRVPELQAALAPGESLVVYFATQSRLGAFVVTQKRVEVREGLVSLEDLEHAARRLRYHLQKPERDTPLTRLLPARAIRSGVENVLRELYDALLRPLAPLLSGEKLVLVPHGAVHGLPLHALLDGDCPALETWEIVTAPSAGTWLALTRKSAPKSTKSLLLGLPEPGIERVGSEVASIARQLPGASVALGESATGALLQSLAPTLRTLHIATHARFREDNPLFSGLKLADGWLLARDLYALSLDAELVTLSACQTAQASVAPGDEPLGLTRGFLAAGARRVAASLWPADDEATATLMTRFYALLATRSAAAALRQAQRELRETFPHPYHWAAFTLAGIR